jgi:hypothetical protein
MAAVVSDPPGFSDHAPVVVEFASVSVDAKASLAANAEQLFSQTAPARLALVTCEDWNGTTYDSNTVVLATVVDRS